MDMITAYQRWVITLRTPNTIRRYQNNVKRFTRMVWEKEPWELTFDDLNNATRLDIKEKFYNPLIDKGLGQETIRGYFPPMKKFVEKINDLKLFDTPINADKFQFTGQVLPSKKQLISRVEKVEKELAELKQLLATYDYDRREMDA
ncbi:MAG: hypothetical protein H9W82_01850 [Lactobacillus sp.]|nr:hypothetical protein [Lactobacillus sp.]